MKSLVWSPAFTRAVKRLVRQNPQLLPQIERTLQQLAEDGFHPSLRTHKLYLPIYSAVLTEFLDTMTWQTLEDTRPSRQNA